MQHFTVLIPTRNRADTLQWAVRSCLSQDYEKMTLLVSSNCSTDGTEEMLASIKDPRLKVIKTPEPTSMSANVEFALGHCLEEDTYVTCIGDDDGLLPGGLAHANSVLEKFGEVGAVTWKTSNYNWPSCLVADWQNSLLLSLDETSSLVDATEMLKKLAQYGVYYFDLPGLWTSLVNARVLRGIKEKRGKIMISMNPDTGSAVLVGCTIPQYVYTYRSVTILGSSSHSNGMSFSQAKTENVQKFLTENTIKPHQDIDLAPNAVYHVTESLLQARDQGLLPPGVKIDMERALRLMLIRNPADPDAVYEKICDAAAATSARHGIPFDREGWTRLNEELGEREKLLRDPIVTEHEHYFSHRCDPRLTGNIHAATSLAGELIRMLRNGQIVSQTRLQELLDDQRTRLEATVQALDSAKQVKAAKLDQYKEQVSKLKKKLDAAKRQRDRGVLARVRDGLRTLRKGK